MRILLCHNSYKTKGGEDSVVASDCALLRSFGHEVRIYTRSNSELDGLSFLKKIISFKDMFWSRKTYDELTSIIKEFRPDVVHFHNIFFMITPSGYKACKDLRVPVVQSLHNFRAVCTNGLLLRNGSVCEKCLKGSRWNSILNKCYRGFTENIIMYLLINYSWRKRIWFELVNVYIVATEFTKGKYVEAGFPKDKIKVKPNVIFPDPKCIRDFKDYVLYVGRLSEEKGIGDLVAAFKDIKDIKLKILGDGPLQKELYDHIKREKIDNVEFFGYVSDDQYRRHMQGARFIVVPSKCYENFPMVVAEAFAYGVPVLASSVGSLREIISDNINGMLFSPGDISDMVSKIKCMNKSEAAIKDMGLAAREKYEKEYSADINHERLLGIYKGVLSV